MVRKMKDSGVEWIGEIPEDWEVVRLKNIIFGIRTGVNPREHFTLGEGNNYYVTIKNFKDGKLLLNEKCDNIADDALDFVNARADLEKDDILFSSISHEGHVFLIEEKPTNWTINESVFSIRPNKNVILPKLLSYILPKNYVFEELLMKQTGSTFKSIKQDHLENCLIVLPPKNEQDSIVHTVDRKVGEINRIWSKISREIITLEEYKKSVITEAVTQGLDKNAEMKDSGIEWIGEIPKHWQIQRLKFVMDNLNHQRVPVDATKRNQNSEVLYDYYGATGVIDKIDGYTSVGRNILIGEDGANLIFRNLPLIYIADGKYWVNNHAHILHPKDGNLDFFAYQMETIDYSNYITGAAQPKLNLENLKKVNLVVPGKNEQEEIANYLDKKCGTIDEVMAIKQNQLSLLDEYKKSLIYEYVTGKREV